MLDRTLWARFVRGAAVALGLALPERPPVLRPFPLSPDPEQPATTTSFLQRCVECGVRVAVPAWIHAEGVLVADLNSTALADHARQDHGLPEDECFPSLDLGGFSEGAP